MCLGNDGASGVLITLVYVTSFLCFQAQMSGTRGSYQDYLGKLDLQYAKLLVSVPPISVPVVPGAGLPLAFTSDVIVFMVVL